MADYLDNTDDYLIPGIGLRFELLNLLKSNRDISVGTNTGVSVDNHKSDCLKSTTDNQNTEIKGKLLNIAQSACNKKPEAISEKSNTCCNWKTHKCAHPDPSAWSVNNVTIKSGKHRTNRVNSLNNDRTTSLESQNSFPGVKGNMIPNRGIPSPYYMQTPPTHHPYCISSNSYNSSTGRRVNGPYRLKPIACSNLPDKDTTACADSCRKDHNINKQMANVSEGISTGSPARDDRWKEEKDARGILKQTTVLNSLRRETVGRHESCNMDKKTMMKRQCMYFPIIDDVTLSPIVPSRCGHADDKISVVSNIANDRLSRDTPDNLYEKQLSPMTISSGYESDYSPPWPSEMETVFTKMIGTVCNDTEDRHTDYFSQSETYPRFVEDPEQCSFKLGSLNQLNDTTCDRCNESERSRSRFAESDRSVISNAHHRYNIDQRTDKSILEKENQNQLSNKTVNFENYLLNGVKHSSTGNLQHGSRKLIGEKAGSATSLNVSELMSQRYRDLHNEKLIVGVKAANTDIRRSKRYRYNVRESLCQIKSFDGELSTPGSAKRLSDIKTQSTGQTVTYPKTKPTHFLGFCRTSQESGEFTTDGCRPIKNIISNNSQIQKNDVLNDKLVETNVSHGPDNCVGDLTVDNKKPVTRNVPNLGCVKSPKGKCDGDYEHIYDVIPGDENILSPTKHFQPMESHLIKKKWTTLQDIRRPKNVYNKNPPALPARSYLTDQGSNSVCNVSAVKFVCSSVDSLYARVIKQDNNSEQLYALPIKTDTDTLDISNKENIFDGKHSRYCDGDYDYVSSETYCRISSTMEDKATKWSSGDVLNFIDGIQLPETKRRDNIYGLLSSRQTRAKLSESLEIEYKLVNMGLLRNSWSDDIIPEDDKPPELPPRVPLNNFKPIYV